MFGKSIRRAAMVVALPALVAGAGAPSALANDNYPPYHNDKVHVTICKVVQGYDYKKHDDDKGRKDRFRVHVSTYGYVDSADVKVKDRECKDVYLKFDDYYKKIVVKEYQVPYGYKFDKIVCYNDYGYYDSYDTCNFQSDWVKVVVYNKVVKHHYYG